LSPDRGRQVKGFLVAYSSGRQNVFLLVGAFVGVHSSGEVGDLYIKGGSFFCGLSLAKYPLTTPVPGMEDICLFLCFISYAAEEIYQIYKIGTRNEG